MANTKTYIEITDANKKALTNFIGLCRMNGLEGPAEPSFTHKDNRPDLGEVYFDMYYRYHGVEKPAFYLTVKVDTRNRFHDNEPAKKGAMYSYIDTYFVDPDTMEFVVRNSKFTTFNF